jgi:hypothetical protein
MPWSTQVQREGVAQVAGRILSAWRNGEGDGLRQELEHAQYLAAQGSGAGPLEMLSTLEMERLEALSGAVESLRRRGGSQLGAVRLLEHLSKGGAREAGHREVILQ